MEIEAIIFDCDGVLIDSEVIIERVDLEFYNAQGLDISRDYYHNNFHGSSLTNNLALLDKLHQEKFGTNYPQEKLNEQKTALDNTLRQELTSILGTTEMLQSLKLKKAVASNTTHVKWLTEKLQVTNLAHYFDGHIYAAECVKQGKPAPDLYLYAAEKIGVRPENCVVLEDSHKGAQAGVAAGMHVVGFSGSFRHRKDKQIKALKDVGVQSVVDTHQDFLNYIESLNTQNYRSFA